MRLSDIVFKANPFDLFAKIVVNSNRSLRVEIARLADASDIDDIAIPRCDIEPVRTAVLNVRVPVGSFGIEGPQFGNMRVADKDDWGIGGVPYAVQVSE